jgi:hypothetical protein
MDLSDKHHAPAALRDGYVIVIGGKAVKASS